MKTTAKALIMAVKAVNTIKAEIDKTSENSNCKKLRNVLTMRLANAANYLRRSISACINGSKQGSIGRFTGSMEKQ